MEMPQYQCHKKVRAVKIAALEIREDKSARIAGVDHVGIIVTRAGWADRFKPVHSKKTDIGYYVEYEDGFASWSPSDVFEAGYTLIGVQS